MVTNMTVFRFKRIQSNHNAVQCNYKPIIFSLAWISVDLYITTLNLLVSLLFNFFVLVSTGFFKSHFFPKRKINKKRCCVTNSQNQPETKYYYRNGQLELAVLGQSVEDRPIGRGYS